MVKMFKEDVRKLKVGITGTDGEENYSPKDRARYMAKPILKYLIPTSAVAYYSQHPMSLETYNNIREFLQIEKIPESIRNLSWNSKEVVLDLFKQIPYPEIILPLAVVGIAGIGWSSKSIYKRLEEKTKNLKSTKSSEERKELIKRIDRDHRCVELESKYKDNPLDKWEFFNSTEFVKKLSAEEIYRYIRSLQEEQGFETDDFELKPNLDCVYTNILPIEFIEKACYDFEKKGYNLIRKKRGKWEFEKEGDEIKVVYTKRKEEVCITLNRSIDESKNLVMDNIPKIPYNTKLKEFVEEKEWISLKHLEKKSSKRFGLNKQGVLANVWGLMNERKAWLYNYKHNTEDIDVLFSKKMMEEHSNIIENRKKFEEKILKDILLKEEKE